MSTPAASASRSRRSTAGESRTGSSSGIMHVGSVGMLVGGLMAIVGSMTPWVMTPFGSLLGTAGPGLWTLACGFLAIAGALLPYRRIALAHALLPGLVAAGIVVWQAGRLVQLSATTDSWGQLLPGIGMVLAAGGAVVLLRAAARIHHT